VRPDYRDVDVRAMLDDDEFDRLFAGCIRDYSSVSKWSVLSSAISLQLQQATGLPIDFQFQRRSDANAEFGEEHKRNALGIIRGEA
jgi:hypothetical protein